MLNKVTLIGNLGADPDTKRTQSGLDVCRLRIATSERRKDQAGNWVEHTEWHTVTCFGKTAENAGKYLSKGRTVYVEGKLRTSSYEKDGEKRYKTEIVADTVQFIGGARTAAAPGKSPEPHWDAAYPPSVDDEAIPF